MKKSNRPVKKRLDQLESRLQSLIEVHLVNYLPGRKPEDMIAQQLAAAMKANLANQADGNTLAPNVYTLVMPPDAAERWQSDPRLLEGLRESLNLAGSETGLHFVVPPTIAISTDADLRSDEVRVVASHKVEALAETQGSPPTTPAGPDAENAPANAFLIVDGVKIFPLEKSVVNIGRRLDNHLVIDNPRISRNHAQLRAIKGRFVLFDLDSSGGTFVNGQRASQCVLYPGDVISLAGVPLIFGQDNPPPRPDLANTSPLSPSSGDRATALLPKPWEDNKQ